ncbi:MarR family winged helix-turn-helix transcriptional regulator [Pedococcus sp. 5OH_020]|uniref:MarR family winged helix-turn-helix transcriptional regulator n=1 Tax=Pedococcus sp. 5OH_020 TaxID=2989814 RepID=UPI0022E9D565|nr:MarR family transcriptional regulator [Pedococcus sp. 5OH_020]
MSPKPKATADDPEAQADAVMRAARVLVGVVARSVAEVEDVVSLPQLRVLVLVASRGRLNLGQVAEALGVHPSNATRTVDRLVVAGLVERTDDPADRRYLALELTLRGHDVVERVMAYRRASILEVMDHMSSTQRRALARALETFAEAAGEPSQGEEAFVLGLPA